MYLFTFSVKNKNKQMYTVHVGVGRVVTTKHSRHVKKKTTVITPY